MQYHLQSLWNKTILNDLRYIQQTCESLSRIHFDPPNRHRHLHMPFYANGVSLHVLVIAMLGQSFINNLPNNSWFMMANKYSPKRTRKTVWEIQGLLEENKEFGLKKTVSKYQMGTVVTLTLQSPTIRYSGNIELRMGLPGKRLHFLNEKALCGMTWYSTISWP